MNEEKQLGVFWGNDALYFVESQAVSPKKIFHIPFGEAGNEAVKRGALSTAGIKLVSGIKSTINGQGLADASVNLSLPTRDIIFRSFTVPWMQEGEIKSVVEFEAVKYIPFALDKLSYAFHPITITENDAKRIRVIFVAIKNNALQSYIRFLEDASLHVHSIEPSASSLIRALSSKNLVPKDQTVALVEKEDVGRIIIVDDEIPQFVREFHLPPIGAAQPEEEDPEAEVKKITSEVRISMDYFNRQNEQLQTKQILLLSPSKLEELSEALGKTLAMPISAISHQSILEDATKTDLGFLSAYGASIISSANLSQHFDFSQKESEKPEVKEPLVKKPINFKVLVKTALICISLIVITIITSGLWTQKLKKDISSMNQTLGPFQDADISMIEGQEIKLSGKMANLRNIRMRSNTATFLLLIPELLPEGTWLQDITIAYDDSAALILPDKNAKKKKPSKKTRKAKAIKALPVLTVTIKGYTYTEDKNEQFLIVNQFLRNLKGNEKFSGFFSNINLETTKAQKLSSDEDEEDIEYPVTSLKIVCVKDDEPKRPK